MNDKLYELWMQRANAEPPAGFADRVMDAVRYEPLPFSKAVPFLLRSSPTVRIAACALACLACLCRMAAVFAVFFAQ